MSVSGCPSSIGARRLGGQCPDWSGETLVKCLQRVLRSSPETLVRRAILPAILPGVSASVLQAFPRAPRRILGRALHSPVESEVRHHAPGCSLHGSTIMIRSIATFFTQIRGSNTGKTLGGMLGDLVVTAALLLSLIAVQQLLHLAPVSQGFKDTFGMFHEKVVLANYLLLALKGFVRLIRQ